MVKPYYQDEAVTIYHADCREVLPLLPKADLVLTDPPYGVNLGSKKPNSDIKRAREAYISTDDTPEFVSTVVVPVIAMCIERFGRVVVTPGNRCAWLYPHPSEIGAFFHPAGNGICRWGFNMTHPILYYGKDPKMPRAYANGKISTATSKSNGHPCPKPVEWMLWLVERCSLDNETVCDPFAGSGTTLRAAKELNRKAIGIEIEERYCEIAAKRCESIQAGLFDIPMAQIHEPQSPLFVESSSGLLVDGG